MGHLIDTTKLGRFVAESMETIERDQLDNADIGMMMLIVEVNYTDDDGEECTGIRFRCSDGRGFVQLGLNKMVEQAILADL